MEGRGLSGRWSLAALPPALLAVAGLLGPWVYSGSRGRSSIELIGSAGALDLIEGTTRFAVVIVWLLAPVLVAAAVLAAAAQRPRLSSSLVLPLGPIIGGVAAIVLIAVRDLAGWGVWFSGAFAIIASALAAVSMFRQAQ
jgi:hypothetical protein